jgi:hypothetical protein
MYRLPTAERKVGPRINANKDIGTALAALRTSIARVKAQPIHLGVGEEQDRWCDIDATGFLSTDKGVLRELYECKVMKDFTITLQGGETLKINSFFASMISEVFRMKLATPLGHQRPRMTYDLPHVRRGLLERLISLLLSETFRVHPSEVEDLTFLANELRFPAAMRAGLDQEMQLVLDLDTDAMEREIQDIYQQNRNESARRAFRLQPTEQLPTLYGFEDRTFRSISELTLGHYYGIWHRGEYTVYLFCGINPHRANTVYAREIEREGHRFMFMPLFTSLKPIMSFDHVRPKSAYPNNFTTQPLSTVTGRLRRESVGMLCMMTGTTWIVMVLGYNNDERVYILHEGRVQLVEIDRLLLIQPSQEHFSEDELNRAWLALSTVPPPPQTYHNRTPIPDGHEPTPGRYYGCMLQTLGFRHFRSPQHPMYFGNIVRVLYLGKAPDSNQKYVLFNGAQHKMEEGALYLPDEDGA